MNKRTNTQWNELEKNKKYGQLTTIEPTDERYNNEIVWKFRCECGEIVYRSLSHVKRNTKLGYVCSCGNHTTQKKSQSSSINAKKMSQDGANKGLLKREKAYSKNKLNVKGVHYDEKRKKYVAQIQYRKKQCTIGRYDTLKEAKEAYQNKQYEFLNE